MASRQAIVVAGDLHDDVVEGVDPPTVDVPLLDGGDDGVDEAVFVDVHGRDRGHGTAGDGIGFRAPPNPVPSWFSMTATPALVTWFEVLPTMTSRAVAVEVGGEDLPGLGTVIEED